jgi:hypothetical protein
MEDRIATAESPEVKYLHPVGGRKEGPGSWSSAIWVE